MQMPLLMEVQAWAIPQMNREKYVLRFLNQERAPIFEKESQGLNIEIGPQQYCQED